MIQHDNAPVHIHVTSMKTWFDKVGLEELEHSALSPKLNPTKHLWDEQEHQWQSRPPHSTLVPDLTKALEAKWVNPEPHSKI